MIKLCRCCPFLLLYLLLIANSTAWWFLLSPREAFLLWLPSILFLSGLLPCFSFHPLLQYSLSLPLTYSALFFLPPSCPRLLSQSNLYLALEYGFKANETAFKHTLELQLFTSLWDEMSKALMYLFKIHRLICSYMTKCFICIISSAPLREYVKYTTIFIFPEINILCPHTYGNYDNSKKHANPK